MKNKKNTYILLTAVLLVWGLLGYRIFSSVRPVTKLHQELATRAQFKPQQTKEVETFTIHTNYGDPFLGTLTQKNIAKPKTTRNTISKKPKAPFPTIIYKGLVSSKKKNQQVFLISINGQQCFFKKNSTQKKITLLRGTAKEVVLRFEGRQQSFAITK